MTWSIGLDGLKTMGTNYRPITIITLFVTHSIQSLVKVYEEVFYVKA